ncbi:MAG: polymer-forming cytoskeletal protein [Caldilineaceae bacterium SB0668_bin_21]|nr:polymer-forming cytoskeletal protein [Caldilineaceae bacterium SB0668_bin_21]MYC20397.1 polymer-forming cytoskeletal protein [Caldilineaceae bacterium SB0662_bin_25]
MGRSCLRSSGQLAACKRGVLVFRRNERPQPDAIEVIIGPRATYNGALRSDSSIRIDGVVESGLLETLANVILTEAARVNCEIRARNVSIRGYFDGVIRADRVELLAGSYVRGALHVNSFLLDEGATLEGELHMRSENVEESLDLPSGMETPPDLPGDPSQEEPQFS